MRDYMKHMLCEGLYNLMLKKNFEKITIKQICDEVGVIRGTFYNHFMDKYEALEYLTKELLFSDFDKENDYKALYVHMINVIDEHRNFFARAFYIEGQNNFEDMLQNIFKDIFYQIICDFDIDFSQLPCDANYLAAVHAAAFKFVVKDWVTHGCQVSRDVMCQRVEMLFANSFKDFLTKGNAGLK